MTTSKTSLMVAVQQTSRGLTHERVIADTNNMSIVIIALAAVIIIGIVIIARSQRSTFTNSDFIEACMAETAKAQLAQRRIDAASGLTVA